VIYKVKHVDLVVFTLGELSYQKTSNAVSEAYSYLLPKMWLQQIEASFFLFLFIEQQPEIF
jgi:hypothetical protein